MVVARTTSAINHRRSHHGSACPKRSNAGALMSCITPMGDRRKIERLINQERGVANYALLNILPLAMHRS